MNVALARTQLRGVYAIAAGFLLLLGVPLFQGVFLAPNGYVEATDAVVRHADFGPLLLWTSQHAGIATVFHLLELVSFLLMLGLPGALRRVLWQDPGGLAVLASGTLGFAAYAVAIVIGIVAGISTANTYASSPHTQAAIAQSYTGTYAFTTLLSQVIGGILVAICVGLASVRMIRTRTLLTWIGYFGLLLAALLVLTAIQFTAQLTQAETTLSPFTFATLALWLVCIGVQLAGVRRMPGVPVPAPTPPVPPVPPVPTVPSDASRSSDGAPSHQSAGQLPPG